MSNKPNLNRKPEEKRVPPMPSQDQEALTVTPEMLLAQIVNNIGNEFVVIPTGGWAKVVETIGEIEKEIKEIDASVSILQRFQDLQIPVIPVSLAPKEEESRIITPTDMPTGDSNIILASR